jgi:ribose transport system substrate-binding protein
MQTRKAALALAVAAAIPLAAAGCGDSSSGSSTSSGSSGGGGGGGKQISVVYVPGLTGNPFYTTVGCGATAQAKASNVKFSVQGAPEFDVAKQTQIVNALTASKPDAIMISITDPKAMIPPLAQAKAAGIKIIAIDGDVSDDSIMETNIQADGKVGGRLAGERMGRLMGGKGSVITVDNEPGSIVAKARTDGFKEGIAKYPGIKDLGIKYTANATAKAAQIVASTASSNPDLGGVFAAETNNTEGALTGVREAKKVGKVHVIGFDTSDPIVKALEDKTLDGTVVQYPYGEGQLGVKAARAAVDGDDLPRQQGTPFVIATPDNVQSAKVQKFLYKTHC